VKYGADGQRRPRAAAEKRCRADSKAPFVIEDDEDVMLVRADALPSAGGSPQVQQAEGKARIRREDDVDSEDGGDDDDDFVPSKHKGRR
jgi:hypothetical protein